MTQSGLAIRHLLERIRQDPRLAYHFDPLTRSMELLTEAYAVECAVDVEECRKTYYASLQFEPPMCAKCREAEVAR